jgi:hypothetical protein
MKAYIAYKKWWIEHEAPHRIPSLFWGEDAGTAFRQHVNQMGLYQLMETLVDWEEEAAEPIQPPPFIPPTPPYKYDPQPYPQPWPAPFTPNPGPGVRNCSKCGINLDGVMGYVCGDTYCPTFLKVTC